MKARILLGAGVGTYFGAMGMIAKTAVDREAVDKRPDLSSQPPVSMRKRSGNTICQLTP